MKGDPQVLELLNSCLRDQLTAINQLFLHARIAKDWGLGEFNEYEYKRSIQAMKAADELIERILFLEGLPKLENAGKLMIGKDMPKMLDGDLKMLSAIRANLMTAVAACEDVRDFISRDELTEILEQTEEQIDWVETQQWLIEHTGLENYLQSQMGE
ncbi:MAG: bacterioferritin [Chromatiaceae bacterium]|nr:bacterioferritin [Gammaproteobacteria bacterium]MCB1881113.1 bacterioferritin [Gammaproteobacteria bacterium]MCP5428452.1 bacterioferritin [Chromatiaceae bacterium]MCP5446030.1 bacterioferritin [Chromatiaceae bacterium]